MMGHSGVRAYWPHPLLFWLKIVDADGIIEVGSVSLGNLTFSLH